MFPRKPRAPTSGTGGGHSRCRAKGMQVGDVEVANSSLQQEAQPRRNIHGGRAPARPGGYPIYHPQHEPDSHGEMVLRKRGKAGSWLDRSWGPLQGNVNWDPSPIMPCRRQADRLRDSGLRDRFGIGPVCRGWQPADWPSRMFRTSFPMLLGPTERDTRPHPAPSSDHRGLLESCIWKHVAARTNTTSRPQ